MIRRDLERDWFLITQPEHARLSGFLAGHWGENEDFPRPEPRDEVVLAAAAHDNGWREWDARPSLNTDGAPAFMYENPIGEVFKIGHRGVGRLCDQGHPYAAALVSRHYVNWAADILTGARKIRTITPDLRSEIEAFKSAQAERQAQLCERLREQPEFEEAVAPERFHRNARYVWTFDMLSLLLCCRWPHIETLRDVPEGDGFGDIQVKFVDDWNLHVSPWPFDSDVLEFAVRGPRLPAKSFDSQSDFWAALKDTPESEVIFRYSPG